MSTQFIPSPTLQRIVISAAVLAVVGLITVQFLSHNGNQTTTTMNVSPYTEGFATTEIEGSEQTAGPRKKRAIIAQTSTTTAATTPVSTTAPTNPTVPSAPSLRTMAWIYPGNPACKASAEIADGRTVHTLKAEYYTINGGALRQITSTEYCNGYSASNVALLKQHSTEQYVTVSSSNTTDMTTFLGNTAVRQDGVKNLVTFVTSNGFTGVELDFEDFGGWNANSYSLYKTFVTELGTALRAQGKKLMIDGPAVSNLSEQNWYVWRYADFVALPVDHMVVMTYDYQFDHGSGQPVAPLDWMRSVITFISTKYPKSKLVIGIPSYGYQGTIGSYRSTILTHDQAKTKAGYSTAIRDTRSGEMTWKSGTTVYFYQDPESLRQKRDVAASMGITSVSVWHLGGNSWF